jgi:hypothetical protein
MRCAAVVDDGERGRGKSVRTSGPEDGSSSPPAKDSPGAAVEERRLGDLNPGWAVNPNRISSAAP